MLTRRCNTNNYAEATICILKDVVLSRTKAFNVVALVEFCITVWEPYLVTKLLECALSRRGGVTRLYQHFLKTTETFSMGDIETIASALFIVKNGKNKYLVNSEIGICSCPAGVSGAFCKHQFFLMKEKKVCLPNAPPITPTDRHQLAIIALGEKSPPPEFFYNFNEENTISEIRNASVVNIDTFADSADENMLNVQSALVASNEQKDEIKKELNRIECLLAENI